MYDLFLNLDIRVLLVILFFGNFVSLGLIGAFYYASEMGRDWQNCRDLFLAKAFLASGFFLMILREYIPPVFSVNVGNTLVFIGLYNESIALLRILGDPRRVIRFLRVMLGVCLFGFNVVEFAYQNPSWRVASASICLFLILIVPCPSLFAAKHSKRFKCWVAFMYLCVLVMLIPRTVVALTTDMHLFTVTPIQTLTFVALVLQFVFSLPAYLLLIKEDTDRIIAAMATTDMLTGLPNRYSFTDSAQRVFERSRLNKDPVAVLFIDIDYFKIINDTYGHYFGDIVLSAFGRSLGKYLRPADLSSRYGGEEFVILLHEADTDTALLVAERIRTAAASLAFPENPNFHFTLSIGVVAGPPADADTLDIFICRADSALYIAKDSGRNCIATYTPHLDSNERRWSDSSTANC